MTRPAFRWDASARAVLGDALARLGPNRCVAEVRPDEVVLTELLTRRDRAGTAALLECGAALSTVWAVLRVLGHDPVVAFPQDPDRPDVSAVVRIGASRAPSSGEWARYAALRKLDEPGRGTALRPVSLAVLGAVAGEDFWPDTDVRIVRPDWAAAVKRLGADLTGQSSLLVTTPGDSRRHHVLAGAALHSTRLAAAMRGFASERVVLSLLTTAEGARHAEVLPGIPQALLLVGLATPKRR
ncbi:hypothetical protein Amsp01_042060 [Amycolatopsis sp. NBRC 101858]|uniref:hypothetical protein n=1 Tax=Amycolatopsis sp. NBRC 101858 TaxID=3032200 RepID=UPI0024A2AFBE|nr:hypothetical protein [Amycolatopsis sp. NBRC 101858]GLY38182.1 hypothetical protein Amsp01_042060 [Amycolatopsis sp. NBRC 101858]